MEASQRRSPLKAPMIVAATAVALSFSAQPAKTAKSVVLENLTWVEAEKALKGYDVALIALGARTKEHGPHLALKNDYVLAEYLMRRVADEVPVVVLPTLQYGYYPAFLEYPGSISIGAETFKNVVMDICRSMHGHGMNKFYVLNTGVSTIGPLAEAEKELAALGITLRSLNILEVDDKLPAGLLKQEGGTHADESETSMMLYIAPETVDMSKAAKDFDPRPGRRRGRPAPPGGAAPGGRGGLAVPPAAGPVAGHRAPGLRARRLAPMDESHVHDITRVIQLVLAPAFLLTAVASLLNVFANRLARVVDRARALRERRSQDSPPAPDEELGVLERRTWLVRWAITLGTGAALFVSLVIGFAFLGFILRVNFGRLVAALFVAAMAALTLGLTFFLREVTLAIGSLRLPPRPPWRASRGDRGAGDAPGGRG